MHWDPTHILWGEQVLLMWILLPPIFIAAAVIPFAGPMLLKNRKNKQHELRKRPDAHALAERS